MSGTDWALVAVLGAGTIALLALTVVIANLFRVVSSLKELTDSVHSRTVPLLEEVHGTVRSVNRELERVDGIVGSVETITHNAATVSEAVKAAVANPLVKVAAFAFGARRAARKIKK